MTVNAEFRQLIKLLTEIDKHSTEEAQLAAIELRLVEAELNPCCLDYEDLKRALKLLSQIHLTGREWQETAEELETYF